MYKPKSLRKALTDAVPVLARNPDMMRVFIDNGNLASTLATSLSFENRYRLLREKRMTLLKSSA